MTNPNWDAVTRHLDALYEASEGLEALFPGRKFTLDGHLVGSIREVVAAYMFGLNLMPASTLGHDATAPDGRQVEIKLTQGNSVALRHASDHMIALHRPKGGPVRVVYNGPGGVVWDGCGKVQKNGQRVISLARLRGFDDSVAPSDRLTQLRPPPV
ncbi:DUF6998 domain-containing protein [Roseinatronobacter sp. NSM]|uniref:DUF6998 domain-containing protein n=1 Tax=Roseinatronobacter sp. NSM TaxID=3457785 RepID=UPI0040361303